MSVGQMAAVGQVHAEDGVAGLEHGQIDGLVGLGARVRLDVHVFGVKQFLGALDGQRLGHIHELAAAVITLARKSFRVFVGHHRAERFQHRFAHEVFRGDQLQRARLSLHFALDGAGDLGVHFFEAPVAGKGI